jgi:predicted nuclease with TOPRIM domain
MSFGFSTSDFIAVIQLSNKVRKQFIDAPNEFNALKNELVTNAIVYDDPLIDQFLRIKGLSNVLRDLEDLEGLTLARELNTEHRSRLKEVEQACTEVLQDLEEVAEKYSELEKTSKKFDDRVRRVWKRLKWEPEDVNQLRSRLTSSITLLNALHNSILRCDLLLNSA